MKHRNYFILVITALFTQSLHAQDEASKLTIPSSPAFSILNFEPSAVMRPTTNKDLAADILNSFDENGKLLMNLGLEVTPYWLQSRPTLTREQYLNPNMGQAFLQSFSLSAATVKDSVSGNNKLGVGFRFKLLNGMPVDNLEQSATKLQSEETIISDIQAAKAMIGLTVATRQDAIDQIVNTMTQQGYNLDTIAKIRHDAEKIAEEFSDSDTEIKLFLDTLIKNRVEANGDLIKKVVELTYQRKGLILEFAGASGFNSSNKNSLERTGFWMNASNYMSPTDLFTLTGRYMFQNADSSISNADVGLGYLKQADKFNISAESMLRWYRAEIPDLNVNGQPITRVEKKFTYRVAFQASYLIAEGISLNINLGKDFDSPFTSASGFFSIFGLNYSVFNKEKVKLE